MARLHVIPTQGEPFDYPLNGDEIVIGRSPEVDLTLSDAGLSRVHTKILQRGDHWVAEDLESANGTVINGQIIDSPTVLTEGDELRLSDCRIFFVQEDEQQTPEVVETSQETLFRPISELLSTDPSALDTSKLREPEDLRRKAERLELLVEVHQALGESVELQPLLELILERAFDHLQPEEGVIFLRRSDHDYERASYRSITGDESRYVYSRTLISEVAEKSQAALVLDMGADKRFAGAASIEAAGIRSLIAAPLMDADGPLGMIALSSKLQTKTFEESDMELLAALASVASLRIRNVALAEEAAERRKMEHELQMARDIQNSVLPASLPAIPGYQLYGVNIPSRGVSGDYYKAFIRRDGQELILMIADVCGKGLGAALLTASLEALSAGPIEDGLPLHEVCSKVCHRLYERTPLTKFATVFLCSLDVSSNELVHLNAGHNPTLLVRAGGEVELFESQSVPIGVVPDSDFCELGTHLEPGDLLVLYTDGITEANDPDGNLYGLERLVNIILENRNQTLETLAAIVDAEITEFASGEPFADDRTLVFLQRDQL